MSKRLMPTYLVNFLKEIYDGTIPSNFGERMVSRQFIARVKELYETLGGANPSDYSRRMVNEYLIKFFNEIEIVEYTDDDVKMTKTISSDLVYPACRINAIGGMSYKSENLLNESNFNTSATNLHSLTNGVLTSTGIDSRSFTDYSKSDFKLYLSAGTYQIKLFDRTITQENLQNLVVVKESGSILTTNNTIYSSESGNFQFTINDAGNYGIMLKFIGNIKPMIVSGSTAPTEYQPYFEGIRDSAVTAVKTYNADNELLDTYTVPSAITSLEGYGQSNPDDPTVYNEVNFIDGKYYEKGYIADGEWITKVAEVTITENTPLLEVVEGGTIVFENTYNQNMPNEVTTWIKES